MPGGGGADRTVLLRGTMWGNRIALLGGHAGVRTVLLVRAGGGALGIPSGVTWG